MSKKHKKAKSSAKLLKRKVKRAARKASRKGKMPAGLKAYWAKKRGKKVRRNPSIASVLPAVYAAKPAKKRGKKSQKRYAKRRAHVKRVFASKGTTVQVRKVRRGAVRKAHKRMGKKYRSIKVNAGSVTLKNTVFGFPANLTATAKGGVKSWAAAAGGAAAAVVGGTFMSRLTNGLVGRFAPGLLSNAVAVRALGAVNYLVPAWAAAKYIPGLSGKTRRAIQAGGMLAAVVEAVRPGMVRSVLSRAPVVGGLFGGQLSGLADGMGDYVLAGLGGDSSHGSRNGGAAYPSLPMSDDEGMNDYAIVPDSLNDYVMYGDE